MISYCLNSTWMYLFYYLFIFVPRIKHITLYLPGRHLCTELNPQLLLFKNNSLCFLKFLFSPIIFSVCLFWAVSYLQWLFYCPSWTSDDWAESFVVDWYSSWLHFSCTVLHFNTNCWKQYDSMVWLLALSGRGFGTKIAIRLSSLQAEWGIWLPFQGT